MISILTHEYVIFFCGVILWQAEQILVPGGKSISLRMRLNYIGRSMIWGGMICVFDDEMILLIEAIALGIWEIELHIILDWYYYLVFGFLIEIIRHKITKQ